MSKVVRVEQVDNPQDSNKNSTNNTSLNNNHLNEENDSFQEMLFVPGSEVVQSLNTELSTDIGDDRTSVDEAAAILEMQDAVCALPANWPKIPEIERRRSCELIKSSTPCVKKAVSHLELIQNIIDEWFETRHVEIQINESLQRSSVMSGAPSKKQIRFQENRVEVSASSSGLSTSTGDTSGSKTRFSASTATSSHKPTLSVQGVGGHVDEDMPYLGADEVISEVIVLLARLDNDRLETNKLLLVEEEIVTKLTKKIDDLCLKRLRDLPAMVQKEHEACIMDLSEMVWHVAYRRRIGHRIKDRMGAAEGANRRFKEDLAFVKSHIPLVMEKLQLEIEAMDKIKRAQAETDQELQVTKQRQAKTEQKSEEAVSKAETERGHIKKELDTVRDTLDNISEELSEAKMLYNSYVHQINELKQQIKDNKEEFYVLRVKNENAKAAEQMEATVVRDLQTQITEAEFERRQQEASNNDVEQEFTEQKTRHAHIIYELESKLKVLQTKVRNLKLKNQEVTIKIEDNEQKVIKCVQQTLLDARNLKRLVRDLESTQVLIKSTNIEYQKVLTSHEDIKFRLQGEEDRTFRIEETLKNSIESLRKQIKEEIHMRTVLQARITSDSKEMEYTRIDSAKKSDKAKTIATEVEKAVNSVLGKVEKLRATKEVKDREKSDLKAAIAELEKKKEECIRNFKEKSNSLQPHTEYLKNEIIKMDKQLDYIQCQSDVMHKNISDMDSSTEIMKKVNTSTEKHIITLTEELSDVDFQLESAKNLETHLLEMYQSVLERIHLNDAHHRKLQENRQLTLETIEDDKWKGIKLNKDLASRYRELQNQHYLLKGKALKGYDDQIKLESGLNDVKQLHALQKKLQCALMEYFRLSGLYNDGELKKLKEDTVRNGQKICFLDEKMNTALDNISDFLTIQLAASSRVSLNIGNPPTHPPSHPPTRNPSLISVA